MMTRLSDIGLNSLGERSRTGDKLRAVVSGGLCRLYCKRFSDLPVKESLSEHMAQFCSKAALLAFDISPGDGSKDVPERISALDIAHSDRLMKSDVKVMDDDSEIGLLELFERNESLMTKGLLSLRYGALYCVMASKGFIGSSGNEDDLLTELKRRCLRFITFMTISHMEYDRKELCISFSLEKSISDWYIGYWQCDGYTIYLGDMESVDNGNVNGLTVGNMGTIMRNVAYLYVTNETKVTEIVGWMIQAKAKGNEDIRICLSPSLKIQLRAVTDSKPEVVDYTARDFELLDSKRMDSSSYDCMCRTSESVRFSEDDDSPAAMIDNNVHRTLEEFTEG